MKLAKPPPPHPAARTVFVGKDRRGNWVACERSGIFGGLFVNRAQALKYALWANGQHPETVVEISREIELESAVSTPLGKHHARSPSSQCNSNWSSAGGFLRLSDDQESRSLSATMYADLAEEPQDATRLIGPESPKIKEKRVTVKESICKSRSPEYAADRIFVDRWSPRGFTQDEIPEEVLNTFFEAARWAPSAFNSQPWRFLYALRGQSEFEAFLAPLIEFNQRWARHAAALIYLLSRKAFTPPGKTERQFPRTSSFDSGAAWANFANQATAAGWAAHGMSGFDVDKARAVLRVPVGYAVELAIAVGRKGDGAHLPLGLLQRERPSGRSPVGDFVGRGLFPERFSS